MNIFKKILLVLLITLGSLPVLYGMEEKRAKRPAGQKQSRQTTSKKQKRACSAANAKLIEAVEAEDLRAVQEALDNGADPNMSISGETSSCLQAAVQNGNSALAYLLLQHRANPNTMIDYTRGYTVLHEAVRTHDIPLVTALLAYGACTDSVEKQTGNQPIHFAARSGDIEMLSVLVAYGANINADNAVTGLRPLHLAVQHWMALGNLNDAPEAVLWLINHGVYLNLDNEAFKPSLRAILEKIIEIYFPEQILRDLVLGNVAEAQAGFDQLVQNSSTSFKKSFINQALILSLRDYHLKNYRIFDFIIDNFREYLSFETLREALKIAIMHYNLRAATSISALLYQVAPYAAWQEMLEEGLLLAATFGRAALIKPLFYVAMSLQAKQNVFCRAALAGQANFIEKFFLLYGDLFDEQWSVTLCEALQAAVLSLHEDVIYCILRYSRQLNLTIDVRPALMLIENILDHGTKEKRYEAIYALLVNHRSDFQEDGPVMQQTRQALQASLLPAPLFHF